MNCMICHSVLIPEVYRADGLEELRWHCINACRNGDVWKVRRQPWLPPIGRKFRFIHHNSSTRKSLRTITCMNPECGKTVEILCYINTKCCSDKCRNEMRRRATLRTHERLRLLKEKEENHGTSCNRI